MIIAFSGNTISIDDKPFELEYQIADAFELDGIIIVLFSPEAYTEKFGQFSNLIGLGPTGELLWTAELPTTTSGDRYYKIASRFLLTVYSIYSYECTIDIATGRIMSRVFFK